MATASDIAPITIAEPEPRRCLARAILIGLVLLAALISTVAVARLASVVVASPRTIWLVDYPLFADPALSAEPAAVAASSTLSKWIADPALFRAAAPGCFDYQAGEAVRACLEALDRALTAAPANGELWLVKATTMLNSGDFSPPAFEALRNSYRVARAEGWIASGRVLLALTLYESLPDDLRVLAQQDLKLVLRYPDLAAPLGAAYLSDALLRRSARPALETLTPSEMDTFLWVVGPERQG